MSVTVEPKTKRYLKIFDGLFTKKECDLMIKLVENQGMIEVDRGIANYHRAIIDDDALARNLYKKLVRYLPRYINGDQVIGLNSRFRFSKYCRGGRFEMHKDGYNTDENGYRSAMTLNIFLNDEFEGGETEFFENDKKTMRYSAQPKPGRGALFDSQHYHRGNEVKSGFKYLMRTDVMVNLV